MENREIVEKIALKIWEITGKTDDRTLQNWKDAEEIVNTVIQYLKDKDLLKKRPTKKKV
ncbi:hypothetical protein [Sulfurihydrogenibium subterraneum]|uniref:hypothetical protein n=1 Tax=Sulfurihydrogenibium subterraneum TaxID=171121 RepID=UPI000A492B6F|nr:hypothetical protein [Sulfurihydrogenibium subterraneum]